MNICSHSEWFALTPQVFFHPPKIWIWLPAWREAEPEATQRFQANIVAQMQKNRTLGIVRRSLIIGRKKWSLNLGSGISKGHELDILCEIGAIWGWIARESDIEIVFKGIWTSLTREIVNNEGITESELSLAGRSKKVSKPRRLFCQLAVGNVA